MRKVRRGFGSGSGAVELTGKIGMLDCSGLKFSTYDSNKVALDNTSGCPGQKP
jgi:hypothetical protein